jgi:ABC-type ATPase with predicted acetyltransferase domain
MKKEKKKKIKEIIKEICNEMGIKSSHVLYSMERTLGGRVYMPFFIELTSATANQIEENCNAIRLIIAHELIHVKYRDFGLGRAIMDFRHNLIDNARILLVECRADIEGAYYSKVDKSQIFDSFMYIKEFNKDKPFVYYNGYPSREKRSYYATKYTSLTEEAKEEILGDYCKYYDIENVAEFIKKINI